MREHRDTNCGEGCIYDSPEDKEIARLEKKLIIYREALKAARIDHYTCEDRWYSCPASGDCMNTPNNGECNCGADSHNAAIDKALVEGIVR